MDIQEELNKISDKLDTLSYMLGYNQNDENDKVDINWNMKSEPLTVKFNILYKENDGFEGDQNIFIKFGSNEEYQKYYDEKFFSLRNEVSKLIPKDSYLIGEIEPYEILDSDPTYVDIDLTKMRV